MDKEKLNDEMLDQVSGGAAEVESLRGEKNLLTQNVIPEVNLRGENVVSKVDRRH